MFPYSILNFNSKRRSVAFGALICLGSLSAVVACKSRTYNTGVKQNAGGSPSEPILVEEGLFSSNTGIPDELQKTLLREYKVALDYFGDTFFTVAGTRTRLSLHRINIEKIHSTTVNASMGADIGGLIVNRNDKPVPPDAPAPAPQQRGKTNAHLSMELLLRRYNVQFLFHDALATPDAKVDGNGVTAATGDESGKREYALNLKEPLFVRENLTIAGESGLTIEALLALPPWLSLLLVDFPFFKDLTFGTQIRGSWKDETSVPLSLMLNSEGRLSELSGAISRDIMQPLCQKLSPSRGWDAGLVCSASIPDPENPIDKLRESVESGAFKQVNTPARYPKPVVNCVETGLTDRFRTYKTFHLYAPASQRGNKFTPNGPAYLYNGVQQGWNRRWSSGGRTGTVKGPASDQTLCGTLGTDESCLEFSFQVTFATQFSLTCNDLHKNGREAVSRFRAKQNGAAGALTGLFISSESDPSIPY